MDRRKPDAIHQDNGRMILKAFQRLSVLPLPSEAQSTKAQGTELCQRRGLGRLQDLSSLPSVTSLLSALQCSPPWISQLWIKGAQVQLVPLLWKAQAISLGGIHMVLSLQIFRVQDLWMHGYLHLDLKGCLRKSWAQTENCCREVCCRLLAWIMPNEAIGAGVPKRAPTRAMPSRVLRLRAHQ